MEKPAISADFTVEDIRKIREYHYELTKNMTREQRRAFYREGEREFQEYSAERKHQKALATT